jgi:hypothetical protein
MYVWTWVSEIFLLLLTCLAVAGLLERKDSCGSLHLDLGSSKMPRQFLESRDSRLLDVLAKNPSGMEFFSFHPIALFKVRNLMVGVAPMPDWDRETS